VAAAGRGPAGRARRPSHAVHHGPRGLPEEPARRHHARAREAAPDSRRRRSMNVTTEALPKGTLLAVEGQVDMHTSPELRTKLRETLERKSSPIVVDLTKVLFIDSSGLATLIEALQAVGKFGGR